MVRRGSRRDLWRLTLVLAALLAPSVALASHSNPRLAGGPGRSLPLRRPGARRGQAPVFPHLTYFGGRVVSSMQVVQVLWGSGSYPTSVSSTSSPSMATFFDGVLDSPYIDWLDEYDANGQHIARGGFVGQFTITPSIGGSTISDAQIESELASQILAGHLPAPTTDGAGNVNTYYAIFFPHGKTITQGGSSSCVSGGFCAYHGTIASVGGHEIYYGVHPDMQAGSGCDVGCGSGTQFQNYTSVASHEMVETITDPEVGLAFTNAPPLAWYDNDNGEIGDICNALQDTILGGDGVTYTVQQEWSNAAGDCLTSAPTTDCGNGAIEPGEACDDGAANGSAASCCSATCSFRASGTACTDDGNVCTHDRCNGASDVCQHDLTGDSDGDGLCDAIDPCTNVAQEQNFLALAHPKVVLKKINTDSIPGNDGLALSGAFQLAPGDLFGQLDPRAHGARLLVRNGAGASRLDVTLPAGSYGGRGTRGWTRNSAGSTWTFKDGTASPFGGITNVQIKDLGTRAPREVGVKVSGKNGTYPVVAGDEPVGMTVVLGNQADAEVGYCGETAFGAGQCFFNGRGNSLSCKQ